MHVVRFDTEAAMPLVPPASFPRGESRSGRDRNLGHTKPDVTQVYAERDMSRAARTVGTRNTEKGFPMPLRRGSITP